MTITETIQTHYTDLSHRAQARIRATRPQLLRQWHLVEGGQHYATVEADSAEDALEEAKANVTSSNYDMTQGTIWVSVAVRNPVTGEDAHARVAIDPEEPDCVGGHEHDWQSPIELVGGLAENPGVHGHGGGVIITEACLRCGARKVTDTWAQDPETGEQGLTSVAYDEAGYYDLDKMGFVVDERVVDDISDREAYIVDGPADIAGVYCDECLTDDERALADRRVHDDDDVAQCDRCRGYLQPDTAPWRWVVLNRADDTLTIARDEDDAKEIAYRCRAGHASDYDWQDLA